MGKSFSLFRFNRKMDSKFPDTIFSLIELKMTPKRLITSLIDERKVFLFDCWSFAYNSQQQHPTDRATIATFLHSKLSPSRFSNLPQPHEPTSSYVEPRPVVVPATQPVSLAHSFGLSESVVPPAKPDITIDGQEAFVADGDQVYVRHSDQVNEADDAPIGNGFLECDSSDLNQLYFSFTLGLSKPKLSR